uniref:Protein kinase domain-containing protein n=1 Tax=Leersia perrieri TaxID=77586 RepID=A0A0D9XT70_9ORYZ
MEHTAIKLATNGLTHGGYDKMWNVDSNHNIKIFTEDEIKRITSNYSTPIGNGGFGDVFKGVIDDEHDLVAVKRYIHTDVRADFMKEVSSHNQISHKNTVKLIGYCTSENTLTIVTEFMPNGNLEAILHNSDISIPLDTRLGIAIGCAEVLSYMHTMHLSNGNLVYHGDIKPANILLGDNLTAKVSDFGLSRLLAGGVTQYTSIIKGTINYMDPIYLRMGCLTPRSDVYSFGIILLELITRKRVKERNINLIESVSEVRTKKEVLKLVDAEIANEGNLDTLEEIMKLAIECLMMEIDKRPRMKNVTKRLVKLWRGVRGAQDIGWLKKGSRFFKWNNAANSEKLGNVRKFMAQELNEITKNYSSAIFHIDSIGSWYRGTLEDNTLVVLEKTDKDDRHSDYSDYRKASIRNAAMISSHISHKNILNLLGCCLEGEFPALVHEYTLLGGPSMTYSCLGNMMTTTISH